MTHVCNGRLCDICRARILQTMLKRPVEKSASKQAVIPANSARGRAKQPKVNLSREPNISSDHNGSVEALLQVLAENNVSRESREQLHSRLLLGSVPRNIQDSIQSLQMLSLLNNKAQEPKSHFSDSSDDEVGPSTKGQTEDSSNASSSSSRLSKQSRHKSQKRASRLHRSRTREDQDVFDFEV